MITIVDVPCSLRINYDCDDMLDKVVYISSDDRSGSTMLELLLANHSEIFAAGELHNLPAYAYHDRSFYNPPHNLRCMCGECFGQCAFWGEVEAHLQLSFKKLKLREELLSSSGVLGVFSQLYRKLNYKHRRIRPVFFKYKFIQLLLGYGFIARDYIRLYESISAVGKKTIIIDSSKWPFRFSYLYNFFPNKIKVIKLYRDPRAVVYSKYKRNEDTIEGAAEMWVDFYKQMKLFGANMPDRNIMSVTYENMCKNPKVELTRITQFLGVEYEDSMTRLKKEGLHHLGGSPSKLNQELKKISYDDSYESALSTDQKDIISAIISNECNFGV